MPSALKHRVIMGQIFILQLENWSAPIALLIIQVTPRHLEASTLHSQKSFDSIHYSFYLGSIIKARKFKMPLSLKTTTTNQPHPGRLPSSLFVSSSSTPDSIG